MRIIKLMSLVFIFSFASAEVIRNERNEIQNFIRLALTVSPSQRLLTSDLVENRLNIVFENVKNLGGGVKVYQSSEKVNDDTPLYQLRFKNNVYAMVTLRSTLPLAEIKDAFESSTSFRDQFTELTIRRIQINDLPIIVYKGRDPLPDFRSKQYWVRLYECSSNPDERCVRQIQLIYSGSGMI